MTSLLKTMYNNYIFSENKKDKEIVIDNEIRFTKVLTKYSTEYNNITFIQSHLVISCHWIKMICFHIFCI